MRLLLIDGKCLYQDFDTVAQPQVKASAETMDDGLEK